MHPVLAFSLQQDGEEVTNVCRTAVGHGELGYGDRISFCIGESMEWWFVQWG
jgi:hypothetical protein